MANILPETEVRGSMICDIATPPYYGSYNIYYSVWVCSVSGIIAFLNFEGASSVVVCCHCFLTGKG